jgi:hypothetical protein
MTTPVQDAQRARRFEDALRVLLEGVSGCNGTRVAQGSGLSHVCVMQFLRGQTAPRAQTVDRLAWFVWRRLNANVLLDPADLALTAARDGLET